MAVDLKFLDMENNPIDLTSGLDYGLTRKNVPSILKFKIKNAGNLKAHHLLLSAGTLNSSNEVSSQEYQNQLKSASWKSFSLKEDGEYVAQLDLGDLEPNAFVEGVKEVNENFVNAEKCIFKEDWSTGITVFKDEKVYLNKLNGDPMGNVARRMDCPALGQPRDVWIDFRADIVSDSSYNNTTVGLIVFPVRINSKGDGKGYLFSFQFRRKDNTFFMGIYKDAKGMTANNDRVYGTRIFDVGSFQPFDPMKKLGARVYNNAQGQPTFQMFYDGKPVTLYNSKDKQESGLEMSDTTETAYVGGGDVYFDCGLYEGDKSFAISKLKILTEQMEQPIFMRNIIGDDAVDKTQYKSAVILSYIEQ